MVFNYLKIEYLESDNGVYASLEDVDFIVVYGDNAEEARDMLVDALNTMVAHYMQIMDDDIIEE